MYRKQFKITLVDNGITITGQQAVDQLVQVFAQDCNTDVSLQKTTASAERPTKRSGLYSG